MYLALQMEIAYHRALHPVYYKIINALRNVTNFFRSTPKLARVRKLMNVRFLSRLA
jgi:hypothetical protein